MFTGTRTENRGDTDPALRQRRKLKQAIRFLHQDSAELLPLDAMKMLGTSNQGQPHHILQRRLLEAKLSRGRMTPGNNAIHLTRCRFNMQENEEEEEGFIYVPCKCLGHDVNVLIDTGCRPNLMSSLTAESLGLKEQIDESKEESGVFPFGRKVNVDGYVGEVGLTIGQLRIVCSFSVVEMNKPLMLLGNKTLKSLKSVIDTEKQMLVFGQTIREQVQFTEKPCLYVLVLDQENAQIQ